MIRHTNAEYALSPAAPPDLATVKEMPDPIVLNYASMNAKIFRFCRNDASQIINSRLMHNLLPRAHRY